MVFFKTYGILGQNARNLKYIMGHNDELAKKLADSKLKTKDFLQKKGVKVAETLLVLSKHKDLENSIFEKLPETFVIKPNNGYGGKGIIVIDKKDSLGNYMSKSGKIYTKKQLLRHFSDIIDGFYSLSGIRDKVLIEKKIILDQEIELFGRYGLPDIRVIVFNMVPVMAMLRLGTKQSGGKANLHAGGALVGIDMGTGKLTYALQHGRIVKSIKDLGDVRGIILPKWNDILTLAVKVQQVTGIGYLGCDVVLDNDEGPLLLEMNIRAGLEVQVVNMAPLKERLEKISKVNVNSVEKGVRLGRDLFGGEIEERIKKLSGKKVLGTKEYVTIVYKNKDYKYLADVKLSKDLNYIDKNFVENILKVELGDGDNEKKSINLSCSILGEKRILKFVIKELSGINISIGVNSLKGFLVDPYKYGKGELPISQDVELFKGKNKAINKTYDEQILKIDKELVGIDKKLIIGKYLTPLNLKGEKDKFIESKGKYDPKFKYQDFNFNLSELKEKVKNIEIPDIPLSSIYISKKEEILSKISFFESLASGNIKDSIYHCKKIFGDISKENLEYANEKLEGITKIKKEEEFLNEEEVRSYVNKFNHIYKININLKVLDRSSRFTMKGNDLIMRRNALVGKREIRAIIAHEIEGHYLRKLNGKKIKYSIFGHGTSGYLPIDEGIAIYNQNRFLTENDKKYYSIYERYFFVNYALKTSYKKLLSKMEEYYNLDYEKIFNYILRLKRGYNNFSNDGVFVRDIVYLNGYIELENFILNGGDLRELYIGKINIKDLETLKNSYIIKLDFSDIMVPFFL